MVAKPKTRKTKSVTVADRIKEQERELKRLRKQVEEAKLDLQIAFDMENDLSKQLAEAAKMVETSPDSVGQVVAGAMELIRKHFPEATSAALYIHNHRDDGRYTAAAHIPIQIPAKPISCEACESSTGGALIANAQGAA